MGTERQGFDMSRLTMGQKGLLLAGGLLFIDLFLPWQKVGPFSATGWSGVGVVLGILVIALLLWEGALVSGVAVNVTFPPALVSAGLGAAIVLFTLIKVLVDNEAFSFGGWIGIILALALAYASWVRYQESQATRAGPPPPPPPPTSPPPPPPA